ncbi:hypothetical protein ACLNGM_15100 [Aureimonas phyllosphaerae]|uniref:hypothetical protein n=1 Tax=Aureimonas phyllosphaerae TaxID=1166078 RepID=UPI003A5C2CD9
MFTIDGHEITRQQIGQKLVYTSATVDGLFVSLNPADEERAESSVRSAIAMLKRMDERRKARQEFAEDRRERRVA